MPVKILEEIDKRKRRKQTQPDIEIVDTKGDFQTAILCPNCNIVMGLFTDKTTGHYKGYICPQCSHSFDPKAESRAQGGRTARQMTTSDGGINAQDIDLRREIVSVSSPIQNLHDNLYQARADKSNSSVTKLFEKKLDYAGKKKKSDSDEELLKQLGFTILDSKEVNPV